MTRGDLRLVFAIVSTAALSSAGVALFLHQPAPAAPKPVDLAPLEHRVATVEAEVALLEAPPLPASPAHESSCDDVSCVLDNYEKPCCARFHRHLPETIDRMTIVEGISGVRSSVTACGERIHATGTVKLHVQVNGNGTVAQVAVNVTPDRRLGACVAEAMQLATFEPSRNGGSFTYPFLF
jgi:hypothetical protein